MFRDIKRDAFHRSHPLVPTMNASPTTTPTLHRTAKPASSPPTHSTPIELAAMAYRDLDRATLPQIVIRQIYSLPTTYYNAVTTPLGRIDGSPPRTLLFTPEGRISETRNMLRLAKLTGHFASPIVCYTYFRFSNYS